MHVLVFGCLDRDLATGTGMGPIENLREIGYLVNDLVAGFIERERGARKKATTRRQSRGHKRPVIGIWWDSGRFGLFCWNMLKSIGSWVEESLWLIFNNKYHKVASNSEKTVSKCRNERLKMESVLRDFQNLLFFMYQQLNSW